VPGLGDPASWQRWVASLLQGPLAESSALGGEELAEVWQAATRSIAGRLLISLARERLVEAERRPGELRITLPGERNPIGLPLTRLGAFELDRPSLGPTDDPELERWLGRPLDIVERLGLAEPARTRVRAELANSIDHLASARLARSIRDRWARRPDSAGDPRIADPEHFVTDGHPWHPMCRTRMGLGRTDSLRHAPELLARCAIGLVEIDERIARVSGDWRERGQVLGPLAAPVPGWIRVPVHPVTLRRLPRLFPELWGDRMRPVASPTIAARPLLSLRTVELPGGEHHLKLSLGIHTTSARRVVSPMSVRDGPCISALLERIQAGDPTTRALAIMSEPAAVGLEPGQIGADARELGAILRRVPAGPGEPWVCAAMAERWPGSDESVLERACAGLPGGRSERVAAALEIWFSQLVPPLLRLFVAHGIALEVHLQNTLVVVDRGRPIGFRVRDLGGIRLHRERLRQAGHAPAFDPDSFVITDDLDEVRGKLAHSLFHAHFAHLFEHAESLGVPEPRSWARLATTIDDWLARWSSDPREAAHVREAAALEREQLFSPQVRAKALLRMRLSERVSDYEYTRVDNALASGRVQPP
jgi:siderophore synthetase component